MPDNQIIKKDKKYKFTPLEKRFIKIRVKALKKIYNTPLNIFS
jgi:hypothetical protein